MIYKIAVCDDNETEAAYVSSLASLWAEQRKLEIRVDTFSSAEAFLFHYETQKDYDILLLDIEMEKMDGVTMAKLIRKDNESVQIIFTTGYSDYISEGYDVSALHYLVKPVHQEKLSEVLDRAVAKLKKNERVLVLELSGEMVRIPFCEIRFLEVVRNYVTIHGRQEYRVKKTLGEFETELDERFFRTGRSYMINLSYIRKVTKKDIYISDGSVLPLPRGMYETLNRAIIAHTF